MPMLNIGRQGIEKSFNETLVGSPGSKQVIEVNASGRIIREISNNKSLKGSDLILSIDRRLQKFLMGKLI